MGTAIHTGARALCIWCLAERGSQRTAYLCPFCMIGVAMAARDAKHNYQSLPAGGRQSC